MGSKIISLSLLIAAICFGISGCQLVDGTSKSETLELSPENNPDNTKDEGVPFTGIKEETLHLFARTLINPNGLPLPISLDFEQYRQHFQPGTPEMADLEKIMSFSMDPNTQIEVAGNTAGTNKGLYFGDHSTTGRAGASIRFQSDAQKITASWRTSTTFFSSAYFYLSSQHDVRVRIGLYGGKVFYTNAQGTMVPTSTENIPNGYYNFKVDFDNENLTYDFYFNNALVAKDLPFIAEGNTVPSPIDTWYISTGVEKQINITIDNIVIAPTIP